MEFFKKVCAYITMALIVVVLGAMLVFAVIQEPLIVFGSLVISVILALGVAYIEENWL